MVTPVVRKPVRRQLFKGKGKVIVDDPKEMTSRVEHEGEQILGKDHEKEVSNTRLSKRGNRRELTISRADVEDVGRQIERLGQ
ncbi:UNVERIFIED_CONTAM: hypothetical protein Sangu_2656900 [Sesamum angustifolium]|uniref:Uncharacterized protein n=1 Tax=Sesamum angustifolium TaxID=2727405 RepID=A0AAW2J1P5_9LAMI